VAEVFCQRDLALLSDFDYILIGLIAGDKHGDQDESADRACPLGLAEKVEAMASRLERSRGWVMKQALAAWVDQERSVTA
jgi:hypothetical protein